MAQYASHICFGQAQTTDGTTAVNVKIFDLADINTSPTLAVWDGCSVVVRSRLTGYTPGGSTASIQLSAAFKRVSGTLSRVGVVVVNMALQADAALAGATFDLDASGTTIRLRVITGVAGQTINWTGTLELLLNQP